MATMDKVPYYRQEEQGDVTYLITGRDRHGKRFRKNCGKLKAYALSHNVWKGTLWEVASSGKRKRIHIWSY